MKTFTFYKENNLTKEFELSVKEIEKKFVAWMQKRNAEKGKDWLEYYMGELAVIFVGDSDGLNSTMHKTDYQKLYDSLNKTKWNYLNLIGIK